MRDRVVDGEVEIPVARRVAAGCGAAGGPPGHGHRSGRAVGLVDLGQAVGDVGITEYDVDVAFAGERRRRQVGTEGGHQVAVPTRRFQDGAHRREFRPQRRCGQVGLVTVAVEFRQQRPGPGEVTAHPDVRRGPEDAVRIGRAGHHAGRRERAVALLVGPQRQRRRGAVDDESGDVQAPLAERGDVAGGPGAQRAADLCRRFLERPGRDVAGAGIAADEMVGGRRRRPRVHQTERHPLVEVGVHRPVDRDAAAGGVVPHPRQHVIEPRGRVVVAGVDHDVALGHDSACCVEESAFLQCCHRRCRLGPIPRRHRVVGEQRRVGHRVEALGVGVEITAVAAGDLDELPFRVPGQLPRRGARRAGVFERPRHEAADRRIAVAGPPCRGRQDLLEDPQVGARPLAGIVLRHLVRPQAEVEDEPAPGDQEVVVAEQGVLDRVWPGALADLAEPVGVEEVGELGRIGAAGGQVAVDGPEVGVGLGAAGRSAAGSGDGALPGEQRRTVAVDQPAAHRQPLRVGAGRVDQPGVRRVGGGVVGHREQVVGSGDGRGDVGGRGHGRVPDDRSGEAGPEGGDGGGDVGDRLRRRGAGPAGGGGLSQPVLVDPQLALLVTAQEVDEELGPRRG